MTQAKPKINKKQLTEFTKAAMQGLLANPVYNNPNEKHKMITTGGLAAAAVSYALTTISELNKQP